MSDPEDAVDPDALEVALRGARPEHEDISSAVARARVAAALFGDAEPVRIGRYTIESTAGAGGGGVVFVARDPELSRRVAIKLMHGGGDRDRMLAEGQALARLSHPNVVPVYDAGTVDDQVYVVMELVEGDTLRVYCEAPARSVRDIVRAYRQAGEGLAAAHRAGFVHRDFKPDNALVGTDGRVRVVDFGLARTGGAAGEPPGEGSPVNVTRAGLGTPRYMAPEQAEGAVLTPAADQYAFCASLEEGLRTRAPSLPRWLDAIVRRGMARAPEDRYASMDALLAALARDPASRWRRRGLVAAVLGVATAAFVIGRADRASGPSCAGGAAELASVWNESTPSTIVTHLASLGTPYARQAGAHVTTTLEGYAARWRTGHHGACEAHRDGAQSTALFDRRVACLARAKAAFGTAVTIVSTVSGDELPDAVAAIGELPDLERCADPSALVTAVAPPPPASATAVAELSDQLASLEIEVRAARPDVRVRIDAAVAKARAVGYPPLVARALRLAGVAAIAIYAREQAIAPLAEATTLALTAQDLPLAVETFARRVWAEGGLHPERAFAGLELVEAIAAGLPDSERGIRALLDNNIGTVQVIAGRRDRARAAFERALAHAREVRGPLALELAVVRTNLANTVEDAGRRAALAKERLAIVEAALGEGHPLVLAAHISAALLDAHGQRARAALEPPCEALRIEHPDHAGGILECQYELGLLAIEAGDRSTARTAFGHVVTMGRSVPDELQIAVARAYVDLLDGDLEPATKQVDAVLATIGAPADATWWLAVTAGDALLVRGSIAEAAGSRSEARGAFEAARAAFEPAVANHASPHYRRRLARAQAALVRSWATAGPLTPALRGHAVAAIAWYRAAGGYDDVIAEVERALAR